MYDSVGIIPAAGKAIRFGGILKEMLPDRDGVPFIKRTVHQLERVCTEIVVVTNVHKITEHAKALENCGCQLRMQRYDTGLWGAVTTAMVVPADYYYFMMPDTVVEGEFPWEFENFAMGLHETNMPERFGVFMGDHVIDKDVSLPSPSRAWGTLAWSEAVKYRWMSERVSDYTQAINVAIRDFGVETFDLRTYYDMASIVDYKRYLNDG